MNDLDDNLGQGVLYVSGTRGYSAYEIAVQNGFVGTEQEWLDSLVGPQGDPGTPFDELTEEQKEEIKGDEGKSAYEIAVDNGFIGTEQDWVNSFLTPDGYVKEAEFNSKFQENYYEEITYTKERYYDTDCYFVTVPKNDNNGNTIDLYVDHVSNKPSLEYAETNFTTLTTNSSFSLVNTQGGTGGIPSVISNGEIIRTNDLKNVEGIADNYLYLGFKENREIAEYQVNAVTAQEMLDDGCLNVFNVYYKLIENSTALDLTDVVTAESGVVTKPHPRIALGVKSNGDILILACDGRTVINAGLTSANMQTILLEKNCVEAWNLDGGGSTSVIVKGSKLNRNIDSDGTADRKRYYTLNVKKTTSNSEITKAFSKIGEEKQNIIQQLIPNINYLFDCVTSSNLNNVDLNTLVGKIYVGFGNGTVNSPYSSGNGYFININHSAEEHKDNYDFQIFSRRDTPMVYYRLKSGGTFSEWRQIGFRDILSATVSSDYETYNTLTQDNTYEKVKFSNRTRINSIEYVSATMEDGLYTEFSPVYNMWLNIRANIEFRCTTTGAKYVAIYKNNDSIVHRSFSMNSGERRMLTLECLEEFNSTDVFSVRVFGKTGDYVSFGFVIAEHK